MRSILFFDLPTITNSDKKEYRNFIKNIKKLGFYMIQESVYVKMSIDSQTMESMNTIVKRFAPKKGSIMILNVTENQFSKMKVIIGENKTDVLVNDNRTIVLWKMYLLNQPIIY